MDFKNGGIPGENVNGPSVANSSDELLTQAVLQGSPEIFEELVRRHQAAVFSHLLRLARNRDDALELAQDTYLKAFKHLDQYDPNQPFAAWLLAIATNTAFNHLNAKRLRKTFPLALDPCGRAAAQEAESPLLQASRKELLQRLEASLEHLSLKARTVFILRYQHGFTCEEISRMLNESLSNVKILLMRARERLREELAIQ
jgi:RNA polymerase sigma-70 factor (ECF subfamily)